MSAANIAFLVNRSAFLAKYKLWREARERLFEVEAETGDFYATALQDSDDDAIDLLHEAAHLIEVGR